MPLPVVIAKGRILRTAERSAVEVVINSRIASTIIGGVRRPVHREIPVPINRYVVAITKLIHVAIRVEASRPIRREVLLAINIDVSRPIRREVSLAINRYVISRANGLVPGHVLFARHAHLVSIDDCV